MLYYATHSILHYTIGCLYVTGGRGSQREKVLSCMERYDPREGRWEHLAPMERYYIVYNVI